MRINYVHVHYANFALIIVMNLTNFNNILTSRLLNSLYISNILGAQRCLPLLLITERGDLQRESPPGAVCMKHR